MENIAIATSHSIFVLDAELEIDLSCRHFVEENDRVVCEVGRCPGSGRNQPARQKIGIACLVVTARMIRADRVLRVDYEIVSDRQGRVWHDILGQIKVLGTEVFQIRAYVGAIEWSNAGFCIVGKYILIYSLQ